MSKSHLFRSILVASVLATGLTLSTSANAAVFTSDPSLPILGVPFVASGAGNCFPAAGFCFQLGALTFTSVVASPPAPPPFNKDGQDILANAFFTGELTTLSFAPIVSVTLTGTVEQEVLGRTFATETGSWTTQLLSLNLAGLVQGHTLTMTLGSTPSTGTTSVEAAGSGSFRIDSFFDVFVDLDYDATTPLHTTREALLEAVPEPASITLLSLGLLGMVASRRRRPT